MLNSAGDYNVFGRMASTMNVMQKPPNASKSFTGSYLREFGNCKGSWPSYGVIVRFYYAIVEENLYNFLHSQLDLKKGERARFAEEVLCSQARN